MCLADEAWNIGPAPAAESYLNQEAILRVAHEARADAIHPGYGFLSENAGFARKVEEAGLIWVGPPPEAIEKMGDKITSRRTAAEAGVAAVPASRTRCRDRESDSVAERLPIAIRPPSGGEPSGRRSDDELEAALSRWPTLPATGLRRESTGQRAQGRSLEAPAWCLPGSFIARCRGAQKLVEETPSPGLTQQQRDALAEAALAAARSCGYVNAGTVEFLFDKEGNFYFLEMNTRLQVEHTVTEMVTGIDLVEWQLRIAAGEPLDLGDIQPRGHALEFRINAENPFENFMPTPGQVVEWREPGGPGIRLDSWITPQTRVSQFYDNLMATLVVWGADRERAIARA